MDQEDRIALFLDYENLALGARDHLGGAAFDLRPIADALAERGRVVVRRAYADWSYFDEDRRMLTRSHVELIEIPQRMGASRKNAADIKMAVDAIELAFERDYISTFVIGTGDSDFTPLVHKLRELNKRVIGVGVEKSTSALLPPACDEFLYYDRLEGVEIPPARERRARPARGAQQLEREPEAPAAEEPARDVDSLAVLVAQTVAGLQGSSGGEVTASTLKRTLRRKDPTFSESDYGFRTFGELLRHLAGRNVVELGEGPAKGDPEVTLPEHGDREAAFALLRSVVVQDLAGAGGTAALSGLKNQLRRARPDFSEKKLGYRGFLQFCRGAAAAGAVDLRWSDEADDYLLSVPG
ncbi:NYN domain-containing protein [Micromonospora sp. NPDC050686]|uniref:NYN domain-containing protein n=1 Tax=Micromonospora sp. NPDC050686 TaxID=3154631 RepID=UPI0033D218A4